MKKCIQWRGICGLSGMFVSGAVSVATDVHAATTQCSKSAQRSSSLLLLINPLFHPIRIKRGLSFQRLCWPQRSSNNRAGCTCLTSDVTWINDLQHMQSLFPFLTIGRTDIHLTPLAVYLLHRRRGGQISAGRRTPRGHAAILANSDGLSCWWHGKQLGQRQFLDDKLADNHFNHAGEERTDW